MHHQPQRQRHAGDRGGDAGVALRAKPTAPSRSGTIRRSSRKPSSTATESGLLAEDTIRSFDAHRDGSVFGEGAGALVLETEASAAERGAATLGEVLGSGSSDDAQGLFAIREDGAGLADAIQLRWKTPVSGRPKSE